MRPIVLVHISKTQVLKLARYSSGGDIVWITLKYVQNTGGGTVSWQACSQSSVLGCARRLILI